MSNLPNSMVSSARIASHTVDHCCDAAPNAAQAAEAKAKVTTTNMIAAHSMRLAAATAIAAASLSCWPTAGKACENMRQRRKTKTQAMDSKSDAVEVREWSAMMGLEGAGERAARLPVAASIAAPLRNSMACRPRAAKQNKHVAPSYNPHTSSLK